MLSIPPSINNNSIFIIKLLLVSKYTYYNERIIDYQILEL